MKRFLKQFLGIMLWILFLWWVFGALVSWNNSKNELIQNRIQFTSGWIITWAVIADINSGWINYLRNAQDLSGNAYVTIATTGTFIPWTAVDTGFNNTGSNVIIPSENAIFNYIASNPLWSILTASNWLTKSWTDVMLWGTTTTWTTIESTSYDFTINSNGWREMKIASQWNKVSINSSRAMIGSETQQLYCWGWNLIFSWAEAEYQEDYSWSYTARSLVDKWYVDLSKLQYTTGDVVWFWPQNVTWMMHLSFNGTYRCFTVYTWWAYTGWICVTP